MKLSIITINKDDRSGLQRTAESVDRQQPADFEYIVIDGESSDGSYEALAAYDRSITFKISERDSGIYAAMNKGLRMARGEFILFLNSGDWLNERGAMAKLLPLLGDDADIYYADLRIGEGLSASLIRYPEVVDINYFVHSTISHQNSLIRKSLLQADGLYREDYRIAADWLFYLRAARVHGARFRHLDFSFASMSPGGVGNDPRHDAIRAEEHRRGIMEVFGELAPSILELRAWQGSDYGYIIRNFGSTRLLSFLLAGYRFFARRLSALRSGRGLL